MLGTRQRVSCEMMNSKSPSESDLKKGQRPRRGITSGNGKENLHLKSSKEKSKSLSSRRQKSKSKEVRISGDELKELLDTATTRLRATEALSGKRVSEEHLASIVRDVLQCRRDKHCGTLCAISRRSIELESILKNSDYFHQLEHALLTHLVNRANHVAEVGGHGIVGDIEPLDTLVLFKPKRTSKIDSPAPSKPTRVTFHPKLEVTNRNNVECTPAPHVYTTEHSFEELQAALHSMYLDEESTIASFPSSVDSRFDYPLMSSVDTIFERVLELLPPGLGLDTSLHDSLETSGEVSHINVDLTSAENIYLMSTVTPHANKDTESWPLVHLPFEFRAVTDSIRDMEESTLEQTSFDIKGPNSRKHQKVKGVTTVAFEVLNLISNGNQCCVYSDMDGFTVSENNNEKSEANVKAMERKRPCMATNSSQTSVGSVVTLQTQTVTLYYSSGSYEKNTATPSQSQVIVQSLGEGLSEAGHDVSPPEVTYDQDSTFDFDVTQTSIDTSDLEPSPQVLADGIIEEPDGADWTIFSKSPFDNFAHLPIPDGRTATLTDFNPFAFRARNRTKSKRVNVHSIAPLTPIEAPRSQTKSPGIVVDFHEACPLNVGNKKTTLSAKISCTPTGQNVPHTLTKQSPRNTIAVDKLKIDQLQESHLSNHNSQWEFFQPEEGIGGISVLFKNAGNQTRPSNSLKQKSGGSRSTYRKDPQSSPLSVSEFAYNLDNGFDFEAETSFPPF